MNSLLANAAIEVAIAGLIGAFAALVAAAANWLNARTRAIEVSLTLADQQRQITHLASVQTAHASAPAPAPIIITPPAAVPSAAAGSPAPPADASGEASAGG